MCISLRRVSSRKSSFGENEKVRVYDSRLEIQIVKLFFPLYNIKWSKIIVSAILYSINPFLSNGDFQSPLELMPNLT